VRRLAGQLVGAVVVASLAVSAPALAQGRTHTPAQKRELERKAQTAFTGGRYAEAAQILENLYQESAEPIYLRNSGRAYQKLGDPDRAISRFQDYLQRASALTQEERDEVAGFIREMEDLRRRRTPAPPPPPPPVVPAPAPAGMTPLSPAPSPTAPALTPSPSVVPPAAATVTESARPATGPPLRLLGGIALGAAALLAAGGGLAMASSWSEFHKGTTGYHCPLSPDCKQIADRANSRALASKVMFGAAVVAGVVGGTLLAVAVSTPRAGAGRGLSIALARNF
jgi:hypothetical protein